VLNQLTVDNADATAVVTYTIDGKRVDDQLKLHRGRAVDLFRRWHLVTGLQPLLVQAPQFASIKVGGILLGPGTSGQLPAFPGAYVLSLPPDPLLTANPVTVVAGGDEGGGLTLEVQGTAHPEIERRVRGYLDRCAASTSLAPSGCPFGEGSSYYYNEPVRWKILSYPTLRESVSETGQVVVSSGTPGSVQLTGGPGSYGSPSSVSFTVEGVVSQTNGVLTFNPQQ
jgi:hypothetical protein